MLPSPDWYRFDDILVKPDVFSVEKAGRILALEPKSIRLLLCLIENRPRTVSKEQLLREVWEEAAVSDNALTRVVAQLRKALNDDAKVARYIETVPTLGYRFVAEIAVVPHSPDEPAALPVAPVEPAKRRIRRLWLIPASLLALACFFGGTFWERWHSHQVVWSGRLLGGSIIASHPRISPDGQLLAFRAIIDGQSQVAVMKPDSASWTVLTHDRNLGAVACVAWARDGSKIYFDREWGPGSIYSIGPLGGEPRLILKNAWVPEPLPDGSLIALRPSAQGRQQVLHFFPDSGRLDVLPATVLSSDTRLVRAFPDGKEIAVLGFSGSATGPEHLFALDLSTHKTRNLPEPTDVAATADAESYQLRSRSPETIATSADGQSVLELWTSGDTKLLVSASRYGARQNPVLLSFPVGAAPLSLDAAPDGSIYLDQSAFENSVLLNGPSSNTLSVTPLPKGASGHIPLPGGAIVFGIRRGGRPQLLLAKPGVEPRSLLHTDEPARLPGAWLGNGRILFVIGSGAQAHLAIASVEDGRVLQRFQSPAQQITAVTVSPGNQMIYYASDGIVYAQSLSGGDPRKIGEGYDIAADPAGKSLYLMRADSRGYRLLRMSTSGGEVEDLELPPGYNLTPLRLSPAAVNRDGRLLLPVNKINVFFYQIGIYDPVRRDITLLKAPAQTVVSDAGWTEDGLISMQVTRWTSSLWSYRRLGDLPSP